MSDGVVAVPATPPADGELLGRGHELAEVDRVLAGRRTGASGCLVITGEAGVGKSTLLAHAVDRSGAPAVLRTTCASTETELPFAGLSDLLRPVLALLPSLPDRQADALRAALALGPSSGGDRFGVAAGTLGLLAAAAGESGLVAVVDDAQWLDASSREVLLVVARRLSADGVVLLFTVRPDEPHVADFADLPTMTLSGLPDADAAALLHRAGHRVAPHVVEHLVAACGGNPLALAQLAASLPSDELAGLAPLREPLPVGRRLEQAFVRETEELPAPARLALLTAAAATTRRLDLLAAALADLGGVLDDLAPAEDRRLVRLDAGRLEFRHPLIRSAVYQTAAPRERRRVHRALADAWGRTEDRTALERRAAHLVLAVVVPDEQVAAVVEAAAGSAAARRSYAVAADSYRAAARLSTGSETRTRRLLAAAAVAVPAGRLRVAVRSLDDALGEAVDPALRTTIELERNRLLLWSGEPAAARTRLVALAEEVSDRDPRSSTAAYVQICLRSFAERDAPTALWAVERIVRLLPEGQAPPPPVRLLHAFALLQQGELAAGRELLRSCGTYLDEVDPLHPDHPLLLGGLCWLALDHVHEARRLLRRAVAAARDASALGLLVFQLPWLSATDLHLGNVNAALAQALEAVQLAEDTGWSSHLPLCLTALSRVEALSGSAQCRVHAERAISCAASLEPGTRRSSGTVDAYAHFAMGLLEVGRGALPLAQRHLAEALWLARERALGPLVLLQFAPALVEVDLRCGREAEARVLSEELAAVAARTGRPSGTAAAARCKALLHPDPAAAVELFEHALALHEVAGDPFELARTRLCLGEHLRRRKRRSDARAPLRAAAAAFERLGATPWFERASAELALTGEGLRSARPSSAAQLTPQELQVAVSAASGLRNAEVAAALFLSVKTVEFHLSNVFRKLDVSSRTKLVQRLQAEALAAVPSGRERSLPGRRP